jgi:hypothetical protein
MDERAYLPIRRDLHVGRPARMGEAALTRSEVERHMARPLVRIYKRVE